MDWDPDFVERSPMLAVLRGHAEHLRPFPDWPDRAALQALMDAGGAVTATGAPVRLVAPTAEPYERQLYSTGELQVRERNWHDLFNVLMWLAYPATKRELNRRHVLAAEAGSRARGRVRDALTLFDESGVLVSSREPSLLEDLRAFRWKRLFRDRRDEVRACMRFTLFGHALAEKALRPYVGMTAHALLLDAYVAADGGLDEAVAESLRDPGSFAPPRALCPLPVLGVPGWWAANECRDFYDNTAYFRPGRRNPGRTPA